MAVKVCLDAGHYGKYNRSPAVSSYYESDMTWKLHNYLKKELESFGIVVVTTRTNQNTDRALYERGAASKGCSSMHMLGQIIGVISTNNIHPYTLYLSDLRAVNQLRRNSAHTGLLVRNDADTIRNILYVNNLLNNLV